MLAGTDCRKVRREDADGQVGPASAFSSSSPFGPTGRTSRDVLGAGREALGAEENPRDKTKRQTRGISRATDILACVKRAP
jgi:hypothetical protein